MDEQKVDELIELIKNIKPKTKTADSIPGKEPPYITLCGSARFEGAFHFWNEYLTLERGCTVYTLSVFPSRKQHKQEWYNTTQKQALDLGYLKKILRSDAIFVITQDYEGKSLMNPDQAYLGESTQQEILWATMNGKDVFFDYEFDAVLDKILPQFATHDVGDRENLVVGTDGNS